MHRSFNCLCSFLDFNVESFKSSEDAGDKMKNYDLSSTKDRAFINPNSCFTSNCSNLIEEGYLPNFVGFSG